MNERQSGKQVKLNITQSMTQVKNSECGVDTFLGRIASLHVLPYKVNSKVSVQ